MFRSILDLLMGIPKEVPAELRNRRAGFIPPGHKSKRTTAQNQRRSAKHKARRRARKLGGA